MSRNASDLILVVIGAVIYCASINDRPPLPFWACFGLCMAIPPFNELLRRALRWDK